MLANVAELGAERMEETIGKASLRDAAIATGVATDKVLALTGQTPSVNIANIVMPSEEEREERRAAHARLDEITRLLQERSAAREDGPVPSFSVGAELPGAPHRQLDEIARRLREAQSA
jgi:hypothetical protein